MLMAYYDCKKHKQNTNSAIEFSMNYEKALIELRDEINAHTYKPGTSICFVVSRPRYREVFAASFRDRIVHHYISLRLTPLFEKIFNPRAYNCRKGKGQLYGVKMLERDIRECSENYAKDCYVLTFDIKNFFMSINRLVLAKKVDDFIVQYYEGEDKEELRYACQTVLLHDPTENCERRSPKSMWLHLATGKSLFTTEKGDGVAIGNLFAQIFANFLLTPLDWYIESLGFRYHGRYVDDNDIVDKNKQKLLAAVPKVRQFLATLGLRLNEKKTYIQHYSKGVEFTGTIIKPGRTYVCNRTVHNFSESVRQLNRAKNAEVVRKAVSSINSYLGILRQNTEYTNRCRILSRISPGIFREYIFIRGHYDIVSLKPQHNPLFHIYKSISNEKSKRPTYSVAV